VEERVVEAEPAGPDQHGALEQRRRDGGRGRGEGERGGAPRRRSAHRGREEGGLSRGGGRRPAEGEGVGGGGGRVEEVGEHGDWRCVLTAVSVGACGFSSVLQVLLV
jgi:hypothetical protein